MSMNQRTRRLVLLLGALIILGAFWISVWKGMDRSALAKVPILDEAHYLQRAVEIRDQGWFPDSMFIMSPLYSYLVAATGSGRIFDEHRVREGAPPHGIRWLQALLWAGTGFLLWRVGRDLFGPPWGWAPPLLWLGYGPAAVLAGQVLMEIPLVFAATYALAVSGGHVGPKSALGRGLISGAMVGAAFLLRGTAIVLVVPVMLGLMPRGSWRIWRNGRSWWMKGVPVLLAGTLVTLPFVVLNSVRAQRLAPPATNGGLNLFIGNGPEADGFFRAFPGYDVETDPSGARYLSDLLDRPILDPLAVDRTWAGEARTAMADNPVRTLGLWVRKIRLHLVGVEIPQVSAFNAWHRFVPQLRALIVPWALLAAAGLAGGVLAWRRQPALRIWMGAALLLIAVQSLFFVVTRYRVILVPPLALGSVALLRELVVRRGRALAVAVAVCILSVLAVWPWGLAETVRGFAAGGMVNEAVRWEHLASADASANPTEAGRDLEEAEILYRRSLALVDHEAGPWVGLGRVLWNRGDRNGSMNLLAEGLNHVPEPLDLLRDLIGKLLRNGQLADALPYLDAAIKLAPREAEILHNMVIAQAGVGHLEEAAAFARRFMAIHPDNPRAYLDLGIVLIQAGKHQEAAIVFEEGLQRAPGHPGLKKYLDQARELPGGG